MASYPRLETYAVVPPSFLLLTGFLGVVYWGKSKTKDQLLRQYLKLAESESPAANPGEELNAATELTEDQQAEKAKASEYSELLYREYCSWIQAMRMLAIMWPADSLPEAIQRKAGR